MEGHASHAQQTLSAREVNQMKIVLHTRALHNQALKRLTVSVTVVLRVLMVVLANYAPKTRTVQVEPRAYALHMHAQHLEVMKRQTAGARQDMSERMVTSVTYVQRTLFVQVETTRIAAR
jgi:hypothetical protein